MENNIKKKAVLKPPFRSGEECVIEMVDLGHNGEGVGRKDGFTVFVPLALPGETVRVRVLQVKSNYAIGKVIEIVQKSPDRKEPKCPLYKECGGCQLQHLSYAGQLKFKRQRVASAMQRIGKIEQMDVPAVLPALQHWHYRNKMQAPVSKNDGRIKMGCYAKGSHVIIDAEQCLIQDELNNKLMMAVREGLYKFNIPIYSEKTGKGLVRHVIGRVGSTDGKKEVLLVLVTNGRAFPHQEAFEMYMSAAVPELVGIVQNVNNRKTNVVMGREDILLWGRDHFSEQLSEVRFNVAAQAFFQVNTKQAEVLYDQVLEYAQLSGDETVIDVYSGTGTISLYLAKKARKVYAIEEVRSAVKSGKDNAKLNEIDNAEFICGDALPELIRLAENGVRADVLVMDPPRAGVGAAVVEELLKAAPKKIVYVSCHPETMSRDIALLCAGGYCVSKVQSVDLFPQTIHVETIVLMSRVKE